MRAVSVIMVAALLAAGCQTTGSDPADHYPAQIAGQCARAKAEAIRWAAGRGMTPPSYGWTVERVPGQVWGRQWAINCNGVPVSGYTEGRTTKIGCGPKGEINYGDLQHEAREYVSRCNGQAHK